MGLLEVLLAMALLSICLWVTFGLFERGTRAFRLGDAKNALASDARRCVLALVPSLRLADSETLDILDMNRDITNPDGRPVQRHGYSLATLSRWEDPALFNLDTATILWDGYRVVYANLAPQGELIMQDYRPAPGPPYTGTLPGFSAATHLAENPALNAGATVTRVLSQSVEEFTVRFEDETQCLRVKLRLSQRGGKKMGGRQINERSEAQILIRLENSGPGS